MNIDDKLENCDSTWYANHVRESQYFLQIVKCKNIECCSELMSDIHSVLADRFSPPPCTITLKNGRMQVPQPNTLNHDKENIKFLPLFQRLATNISISHDFVHTPYDFYCPTVQSLKERCCNTCGLYFASKKAATTHKRFLKHSLSWGRQNNRLASVVAKRKDEVLCITKEETTGEENAEWIDIDDF